MLSYVHIFTFVFVLHALLGIGNSDPRKCYSTKNCADSGTTCKLSHSDDLAPEHENVPQSDAEPFAYEPLMDYEMEEGPQNDSMQGDAVSDNHDTMTKVAEATPHKDLVKLKKGVNVTVPKTGSEPAKDEIIVGTMLFVSGWRCTVLDINAPGRKTNTSVLADFSEMQNSMDDPSGSNLTTLATGKKVQIATITCKVVGVQKPDSPIIATTAATAPTTLTDLIRSSGTSMTKKQSLNIATSTTTRATVTSTAVKSTPSTAVSSEATTSDSGRVTPASTIKSTDRTAGKKQIGQCVCDPDTRFACTEDADCMARFNDASIVCHVSSQCPSEIGTGYCRRRDSTILDDSAQA